MDVSVWSACMFMHHAHAWCLRKIDDGIGSSGTGTADGYRRTTMWGLGIEPQPSGGRAASAPGPLEHLSRPDVFHGRPGLCWVLWFSLDVCPVEISTSPKVPTNSLCVNSRSDLFLFFKMLRSQKPDVVIWCQRIFFLPRDVAILCCSLCPSHHQIQSRSLLDTRVEPKLL